jgi:stress response protein YsnF
VALPLESVELDADQRVVVRGLTEEQIADMPDYEHDDQRFRELESDGTVEVQTTDATTLN